MMITQGPSRGSETTDLQSGRNELIDMLDFTIILICQHWVAFEGANLWDNLSWINLL